MAKLEKKSQIRLLTVMSIVVYFASYLTRINYAAVLVEFIAKEGVSKSAASLATTVAFITYGAGQLISGYFGDRISPRKLIFGGFLVTLTMNVLMPVFSPNIGIMTVIWGINGLAQAFMWPPLVKLMTAALTAEDYTRSIALIGLGSGGGSVAVYLIAPLIISISGWKTVFYFCSGFALVVAVLFLIISGRLLRGVDYNEMPLGEKPETLQTELPPITRVVKRLLPVILISIALQGILRDGLQTWMPSFISETFHLESTVSILTGVCLPVFHVVCGLLAYPLLQKMHGNIFGSIVLLFSGTTLFSIGMTVFGGNMIMSLLLLSLIEGFACAINGLQTCYIPKYFIGAGNVSFISGLLNFGTYIGSAASTYLFAVLSEKFGWTATLISWAVFSILGVILSLYCERRCAKVRRV